MRNDINVAKNIYSTNKTFFVFSLVYMSVIMLLCVWGFTTRYAPNIPWSIWCIGGTSTAGFCQRSFKTSIYMSPIANSVNHIDENTPLFTLTVKQFLAFAEQLPTKADESPSDKEPEKIFLSRHEARQFLGGISLTNLDKLAKEGKLQPCRPTPDRIFYYLPDLVTYMLSTKKAS